MSQTKLWEIVVSPDADSKMKRKIRRILKPVHDVTPYPKDCLFCGEETSWRINDKPVCPKCSVDYGFLDEGWRTDPCEVCGQQGEWWTDGDPAHFLCHRHTHAWFVWPKTELDPIIHKNEPEKWHQVWESVWAKFIEHEKALQNTLR